MSDDPVQEILDAMVASFERAGYPLPDPTIVLTDRQYESCMADLVAMGLEPTHDNLTTEATKIIGPCIIQRMDPLT